MKNNFQSHQTTARFLGITSGLVLVVAHGAEYLFDLQPCVLCLYQRIPYALVIVLMLFVAIFAKQQHVILVLFCCAPLIFLAGAGLAIFHVGVEQKLWPGTSECGNSIEANSIKSLREQLLAQPIIRCDKVTWSLFGISMAGYNFLISVGLFLYCSKVISRKR